MHLESGKLISEDEYNSMEEVFKKQYTSDKDFIDNALESDSSIYERNKKLIDQREKLNQNKFIEDSGVTYEELNKYFYERKNKHRNRLCPCGSNKKFKKCCWNKRIHQMVKKEA